MRKFVNYRDGRPAGDNGVDIHLLQRDSTVLNPAHRHTFQISDHLFGVFAAMSLDHGGYNVYSLFFEQVGIFQHLIGLPDPRRSANVSTPAVPLALPLLG